METDIGNKVQEIEQELQRQAQIRAKEMTIPEGKTTMKNIDYVGKRAIGQKTAVIVLLVKNEQKKPTVLTENPQFYPQFYPQKFYPQKTKLPLE